MQRRWAGGSPQQKCPVPRVCPPRGWARFLPLTPGPSEATRILYEEAGVSYHRHAPVHRLNRVCVWSPQVSFLGTLCDRQGWFGGAGCSQTGLALLATLSLNSFPQNEPASFPSGKSCSLSHVRLGTRSVCVVGAAGLPLGAKLASSSKVKSSVNKVRAPDTLGGPALLCAPSHPHPSARSSRLFWSDRSPAIGTPMPRPVLSSQCPCPAMPHFPSLPLPSPSHSVPFPALSFLPNHRHDCVLLGARLPSGRETS